MNTIQEKQIHLFRSQGYSFQATAEALGLTVGAIKSYCYRHPASEPNMDRITRQEVCPTCGAALVHTPGAKKRRFCSEACRHAWWGKHPEAVRRKAYFLVDCLNCGIRFLGYGNPNRKYCSHACYISHRYPMDGDK